MSMPKLLGDASVVELLSIAKNLEGGHNPVESTIRGQALVEAAIIDAQHGYPDDDDAHDAADERLQWLDAAEEELGKAARIYRINAHIEGLYDHLWAHYRTRLFALFMPIYRDLACGDVTEQSLDEVYESLRAFIRELYKEQSAQLPVNEAQVVRGILSEAIVPTCLIKTMDGAAILPASLRADSGERDGHIAHDLIYVPFDTERAKIDFDQLKPWQVKGTPEQAGHSQRYDTEQVALVYTRKSMTDSQWNRLMQDILSTNVRTRTTRMTEKFTGSILEQAGIKPSHGEDQAAPSHPELRRLRGLFLHKK